MLAARFPFALSILCGFAFAQSAVLVVDDDFGGGDYSTVQQAVDAAPEGALILVRDGGYPSFSVVGKSLTIQGVGDVSIGQSTFGQAEPTLRVMGLAADQSFVMRGVDAETIGFTDIELTAVFADCDGPIVLEDCAITSIKGHAMDVGSCASVTLSRCLVDPGRSFYNDLLGDYLERDGLAVSNSAVWIHDSIVRGSHGPDASSLLFTDVPNGDGGVALRLTDSRCTLVGSVVRGGDGGTAPAPLCFEGGDAGAAVAFGGVCDVTVRDSEVQAGTPGVGTCGFPDGAAAPLAVGLPATLVLDPRPARSFQAESPVPEGGTLALDVQGEPGDVVFAVVGLAPLAGLEFPQFLATLHVASPAALFPLGTVDAAGTLQVAPPVPSFGDATLSQRFVTQALVLESGGGVSASGPSVVAVLDQTL